MQIELQTERCLWISVSFSPVTFSVKSSLLHVESGGTSVLSLSPRFSRSLYLSLVFPFLFFYPRSTSKAALIDLVLEQGWVRRRTEAFSA